MSERSTVSHSSPARAVRERMEDLRPEFVDFVKQLVLEESPSDDPEAQAGVRALLREALAQTGLEVEYVPGERTGGHLLARAGTDTGATQLLVGHMDTVWPLGTLARMPVEEDDGVLRGPGVFDMKAGLAMGIFALRALRDVGADPGVRPVFLITSDEEIGSPESRPLIDDCARQASRAFVLEPALGLDGKIKTRRKGTGHFTIEVIGVSAHCGLAPEEGASAIVELATLIPHIQALADPGRGTTVNVGIIQGGSRVNVVADLARAELDIRVWTADEGRRIENALRALEPTDPRTRIDVRGGMGRGPLEHTPRNVRLWEAARTVGADLGLALEEGSAGGASDGNLTSAFTATLDGLGAVGDGAHALHEFVYVDRVIERIGLLAGLLAGPVEDRSAGRGRAAGEMT